MTRYVLDASVAAKWFLPISREGLASEARELLRTFTTGQVGLVVPDLFWPELGNVLWKAARLRRISSATAAESIEAIAQIGLETAPSKPLLRDAFAIAVQLERTVYDAIYVALALATSTSLVTADERLAKALAVRFPVRWLGAL